MTRLKEAFFGAFSPDSSFFAAVGKASRVLLYNLTGEIRRFPALPFASGISLSNDEDRVALTSPEHKLCIAQLNGEIVCTTNTQAEASDGLWTPDSCHVLIPFWNKELHLVNSQTGKTEDIKEIGKSPRIQPYPAGFSLTHWRIDEFLYPRIETFDWNLNATSEPVELSINYSRFGTSQNLNYFWRISPIGLEILDRSQNVLFTHSGEIRSATISPSEKEIAVVENNGLVTRRLLPSGEVISTYSIPYATQPHYSPDESMLAVTSQKQGVLLQI